MLNVNFNSVLVDIVLISRKPTNEDLYCPRSSIKVGQLVVVMNKKLRSFSRRPVNAKRNIILEFGSLVTKTHSSALLFQKDNNRDFQLKRAYL